MIEGTIPSNKLKLVEAWVEIHKEARIFALTPCTRIVSQQTRLSAENPDL
jgi:hypothetical protein